MADIKRTAFYEICKECFLEMLARKMKYSPAAKELPKMAELLAIDLYRKGFKNDDAKRIRQGFYIAGTSFADWPSTFEIIKSIPARRDFEPIQKSLPVPPELLKKRAETAKRCVAEAKKILNKTTELDKKNKEREVRHKERLKEFLNTVYGTMPDSLMKQQQKEEIKRKPLPQQRQPGE